LEKTMLFVYVGNFGLVLVVIGVLTNSAPYYWNYKVFLNEVQFLFKSLGIIICHIGVMFSFHLTSTKTFSTTNSKDTNKKSLSSKRSR